MGIWEGMKTHGWLQFIECLSLALRISNIGLYASWAGGGRWETGRRIGMSIFGIGSTKKGICQGPRTFHSIFQFQRSPVGLSHWDLVGDIIDQSGDLCSGQPVIIINSYQYGLWSTYVLLKSNEKKKKPPPEAGRFLSFSFF